MASLEDLSPEARDELALLARQLAETPATRKQFLRLTKTARPDLPVPELDIEDRANSVLESANKRVATLEGKLLERDAVAELEKRRKKLKDKGLAKDDAEVEEIEKLMLDKGISTHETAAEYHAWMKQAAVPTPSTYNTNVIDGSAKETLAGYWKNPARAAREAAGKMLTDIRAGRSIGI